MARISGPRLTLSPENQLLITCPIFNSNTKIAGCFQLHGLYMRGEGPPVRRGCQVAMAAGKCPVNVILKDMLRKDDDPYHSVTAKLGNLAPDILDRIAPVLVLERHIERANLPPAEAAALMKANEDARSGIRKVVKAKRKIDPTPDQMVAMQPSVLKTSTETKPAAAVMEAAKSGDMAAAINEEMKAS
jgi:hypothetical protein